jgi:Protein of unknown function (DUF4446)
MMQQFPPLYAALIAFGGALVALAIYHAAVLRPAIARMQALVGVHDELISGGAGGASERLAALERADTAIQAAMEGAQTRVATLEALSASDVSRCGFVRYDAFADAESGLSYALALLNRQGNGVVLTSIYSRADTRTYGKPVEAFRPTIQASAEELEAIERARAAAS